MNDEEVKKKNRTLEFLRNFLDRTAFGSKEGRQAKYDESKKNILGFFVGQVMKATQGKANPKMVNELLRKKLDG